MLLWDLFTCPPPSSTSSVTAAAAVVIVEAEKQESSAEQIGLQTADSQHIDSTHQSPYSASKSKRSRIWTQKAWGNAVKCMPKITLIIFRPLLLQKHTSARRHRHHHHHRHRESRHSRPETVQEEIEELEDSPSLMYEGSSTVDASRDRSHRHDRKESSSVNNDRYKISGFWKLMSKLICFSDRVFRVIWYCVVRKQKWWG